MLIVGGGPAGYATALALAQHGFRDITLLERSASAAYFDSSKGFVYSLLPIARQVLDSLGVTALDEVGALSLQLACHVHHVNDEG